MNTLMCLHEAVGEAGVQGRRLRATLTPDARFENNVIERNILIYSSKF